jgi:hypothetical protein
MIGDLIGDNVDPDSVAQIAVEVLDRGLDYPSVIAESLAPHSERFGLGEGDGAALLEDLLNRAQYRDRAAMVAQARSR